jgi:hypothetical protein
MDIFDFGIWIFDWAHQTPPSGGFVNPKSKIKN